MNPPQTAIRLFCGLAAVLTFAGCSDQWNDPIGAAAPSANREAGKAVPRRVREAKQNFVGMPEDSLWAYISAGDGTALVGLKSPGQNRGVYQGRILVSPQEHSQARQAVISRSGAELVSEDEYLPVIRVKVPSQRALSSILALPMVDYVEPAVLNNAYDVAIGCTLDPVNASRTVDFSTQGIYDVLPRTYPAMGITSAWRYSQGRGKTVGLTDTGIYGSNLQLNQEFQNGHSWGRLRSTFSEIDHSGGLISDEGCSHGPRMAGVIGAPRDDTGPVGVAYGANLVNVRVNEDIAHFSTSAAASGIHTAAQRSDIIVMAWGSVDFWSNAIEDAIYYWHNQNRLFVGAAGTSLGCWPHLARENTMFPAEVPVVIAVTAVDDNGELTCNAFHGPGVDMAANVDQPTTGRGTEIVSIMGSSNAAGVVGGVAALVWSRYPGMTNTQVRQRLESTAVHGAYKMSDVGYGAPRALQAVGGFSDLRMQAPKRARPGTYVSMRAVPTGDGPFRYLWSTGDTTSSVTFRMGPAGTSVQAAVNVTDPFSSRPWPVSAVIVSSLTNCDPATDPNCAV